MTTTVVKPEESSLAVLEKTLMQASEVSETYLSALTTVGNKFILAIRTATAVNQLRKIMENADVVRLLRGLAGTSLGFLTDKHHLEYDDRTIADCATEAILRGFNITGNEFNIIRGRPYFTKNGMQRKVREFPGLNGTYDETLELPEVLFSKEGKVKGAIVRCSATWEFKNTKGSIQKKYEIKGDNTTGADAFIGKAARKLARDVLAKLQGHDEPEGEIDDLPVSDDVRTKRAYVISSTTTPVSPIASDKTTITAEEIPGLEKPPVDTAKPAIGEMKETPSQKLRNRIMAVMGSEDMFIRALHMLNPTMPTKIEHVADLSWAACDKYLSMSDDELMKVLDRAEEMTKKAALAETEEIPFE